ncbi:protein kinase family protein [Streptomyces sp. NPDC017979]|uniref:protein kinase family protein n=1 Tax=Streptomyces sp. NPDC017979 TaxID=3365024 RepID=UPI0037A3339B
MQTALPARLAAHRKVATALAPLGDRRLAELLSGARPLGSGIGGTSALLEVDGVPVFVKRVPLTDTERRPEHRHSTANLFGLPPYCQYGMGAPGSPGFGAWRELAAHTATTTWVLTGGPDCFPLTHHWRILPDAPPALPDELADVDRAVDYWGDGVRRRIEELARASASLVLFLEHVPRTLHDHLAEELRSGDEQRADEAVRRAERQLATGVAAMNDHGLLHFDAHFRNVLTDGRRLYFADYGLALSSRFGLSPAEADFLAAHATHDRAYALSYLVNWLITTVYGHDRTEREALVHACAQGERPPDGPAAVRAVIERHAPIAALVTDFYGRFTDGSRETPYPAEAIGRALKSPDALTP